MYGVVVAVEGSETSWVESLFSFGFVSNAVFVPPAVLNKVVAFFPGRSPTLEKEDRGAGFLPCSAPSFVVHAYDTSWWCI